MFYHNHLQYFHIRRNYFSNWKSFLLHLTDLPPFPILWILLMLLWCDMTMKEHANNPKENTHTQDKISPVE